jgi:hypothetical protein
MYIIYICTNMSYFWDVDFGHSCSIVVNMWYNSVQSSVHGLHFDTFYFTLSTMLYQVTIITTTLHCSSFLQDVLTLVKLGNNLSCSESVKMIE